MLFVGDRKTNLHYRQHKASGYVSQFHLLNVNTSVGLSYTGSSFDLFSLDGYADSTNYTHNRLLTPFVNINYDNLDDTYFAKHGIKATLAGRYHIDTYAHKGKYPDFSFAFQSYITLGNGKFTIIPQAYGRFVFGDPEYFNLFNVFGGPIEGRHLEQQLPFIGYTTVEACENKTSMLRCDLRYNFYGKHYLTAMYNYLAGFYWDDTFSQVRVYPAHGAGLQYSYDSLLGPISLTVHWSNRYSENHFGAYFSFGYTF